MKRLGVLLLTFLLALCVPLSAFAAGTIEVTEDVSVSDDYDWTRFKGQNITLNVYNWGEYISNGSDDSVDVVAAFEQLTGIHVNYTTFDSNESLYAKLKSGAANYDVIIPSDYMAAKMIAEGMLKPLNYDNIPNFQNIDAGYRDPDYDPENAYTVPYMLCTTGIIYNTTMVDKAPTSWADLWDERYSGNILMFNNSRDAYAIAAFKAGKSINPQSTEEVDEVMCEPDIGKANSEYIGYTTPMQSVWEILDDDLKYSEIAYPPEEAEAKEKVFTALSDEVNTELDVKWSEMKSYDEGGSGIVFLLLLLAMVALAFFNIWRKLRKKSRNQY